jgi:hypothetical protein
MEFSKRYALAGQVAHRIQRRAPIRLTHVHEHAIYVEDQYFRRQRLFHLLPKLVCHGEVFRQRKECTPEKMQIAGYPDV